VVVGAGKEGIMGRWTYYSPLLVGTIVGFVLFATYREFVAWHGWALWAGGVGLALLAGLGCQLVMFGTQGAFAQVLPAPSGRSIRGRGAVVTGGLVLAAFGLGLVSAVLHGEEGLLAWYRVAGGLGLASFIAAIVAYLWSVPTAARDFGNER
jgi:hypothetical protein